MFEYQRILRAIASIVAILLGLLTVPAMAVAQQVWPHEDAEAWGLALIDVETTGLQPGYHEMIDVGLIYIDLDGNEIGRFYVRIQPDYPERLSPGAEAVNAYDVQRWEALDALAEPDAAAAFRAFHTSHAGQRTWLLTAYNSWFDAAFFQAFLEEEGLNWRDSFHYFVLDLPSMAWGQGFRDVSGGETIDRLGVTAETSVPEEHTGITGAEFNLAFYRALLAHRQQAPE